MSLLPFKDVGYCKHGLGYRKRTRLWNNVEQRCPQPLCREGCDPMAKGGKRHREQAQRLPAGNWETWGRELLEDPARGALRGPRAPYSGDHG